MLEECRDSNICVAINVVAIFIIIMIKILVKAQPVYWISIKYYCLIDNRTCSETNNQVSLSLSVSLVGHISNQDLLLLDGAACIISINYLQ